MHSSNDTIRGHEVLKYCNDLKFPIQSPFAWVLAETSTLRGTLTIFTDALVARFSASGAFVILTNGKTQYLLAGSTKSQEPDVTDTQLLGYTDDDSNAWLAFGRKVLDLDLKAHSAKNRQLVVLDANQHDRLKVLSSVTGVPSLRFCAAAPITTKAGDSIGYVLVLDTVNRQHPSAAEVETLSSISQQCMNQLELFREVELRRRESIMTEGLASFLQQRPVVDQMLEDPPPITGSPKPTHLRKRPAESPMSKKEEKRMSPDSDAVVAREKGSTESETSRKSSDDAPQSDEFATKLAYSILQRQPEFKKKDVDPSQVQTRIDDNAENTNETPYRRIFRRAAEFLRTTLHVDGVIFADGLVGFHGTLQSAAEPELELQQEMKEESEELPNQKGSAPPDDPTNAGVVVDAIPFLKRTPTNPTTRTFTSADYRKDVHTKYPAEILGLSMCSDNVMPTFRTVSKSTLGLAYVDEGFLQYMMKSHPQGKVWYFDDDDTPYHCQDNTITLDEDPNGDTQRMLKAFVGVRQLTYAPLTDPVDMKSLAACFIWSTRVLPVFTDADLPSIRTFLHIVEAEISRIDNIAALKQKESFMSSVSHELRSPLHGILGAVEFLVETGLDSFQQSLADTINACGTTLHETLSSVLSFAKINEFERRRDTPNKALPRLSPWSLENKDLEAVRPDGGSDGMFLCTNVAELCEDVLEVVLGGHLRSWSTADDHVTITLDVAFHKDWNYMTEPGALRRIYLNILTNALKYTSEGSVAVSLDITQNEGPEKEVEGGDAPPRAIIFTVKDSGKGMSDAFLENHLFVPFSQEDPLGSDGVGLGMSIVKSLVALLGGQMKVESEVGKGTEMTVAIPMHLEQPQQPHQPNGKGATSTFEQKVISLRRKALKVAMFNLPSDVEQRLRKYLVEWFCCEETQAAPDVVFVGGPNDDLPTDIHSSLENNKQGTRPAVISVGRRYGAKSRHLSNHYINARCFEPLGPGKIAKSLLKCVGSGEQSLVKNRIPSAGTSGTSTLTAPLTHPGKRRTDDMNTDTKTGSDEQSAVDKSSANHPDEGRHARNPRHVAASTPHMQDESLSILLVEDNPINLNLLKTYLRKRGYDNIVSAENGLLAVQAAIERTEGFSVIFMDLSMPEMDGFEATRRIRELEDKRRSFKVATNGLGDMPPSPSPKEPALILALTGLASARDRARAYESGVDMFIAKPLKFKELGPLLKKWEKGERPQ